MAGFDEIVEQTHVKNHFRNAIKLNKLSHAYILNGEAGMGKKMMASAFAMTLQCEKKGEEPCMECRSCKQALTNNNPDIKWITHEKPNVITVDEIREQLVGDVQIRPYSNDYKVYIVDDASKMNAAAQNAMLKTIEEPPHYVVIILLTDNKDMLLSTILSRCISLEMKPIKESVIVNYLMEKKGVVDYRAKDVVQFAGGNIGKAINMAINDDFLEQKDRVVSFAKNIRMMSVADLASEAKETAKYKDTIDEYLDLLLIWYRDLMMYKSTQSDKMVIYRDDINEIKKQAKRTSFESIEKVLQEINELKGMMKVNVNLEVILELLYVRMRECVEE